MSLVVQEIRLQENFNLSLVNISDWIGQIVQNKIIENWKAQDIPPHLATLEQRILRINDQGRGRLLGLYQKILIHDSIDADNGYYQSHLQLTGLVVKREGKLQVYNPIYQAVFNQNWVDQALAKLRPPFYAEALRCWRELDKQDEAFLLWGQALAAAEDWAMGKKLSDEDEKFLSASREVEKREQNRKLELAEEQKAIAIEKNRIITEAQEEAKQEIIKVRKTRKTAFIIAGIAGIFALGGIIASTKEFSEVNSQRNKLLEADINLSARNAKIVFLDNHDIEAILLAINSGTKLNKIKQVSVESLKELEIFSILPQVIYGVLERNHGIAERNRFESHQGPVKNASFSPDGQHIVTASEDKTAKVWDIKGNLLATFSRDDYNPVINPSFSPDGRQIITISYKTPKVWDLKRNLLATLSGDHGYVIHASFSPDGWHIFTISPDRTPKFWDLKGNLKVWDLKGNLLATLPVHRHNYQF